VGVWTSGSAAGRWKLQPGDGQDEQSFAFGKEGQPVCRGISSAGFHEGTGNFRNRKSVFDQLLKRDSATSRSPNLSRERQEALPSTEKLHSGQFCNENSSVGGQGSSSFTPSLSSDEGVEEQTRIKKKKRKKRENNVRK